MRKFIHIGIMMSVMIVFCVRGAARAMIYAMG